MPTPSLRSSDSVAEAASRSLMIASSVTSTISLRGEFASTSQEDAKYLMCELHAGKFSRIITLPTALEPSKAEASIKNGVLHLVVPKAEAHRPKTIKIKAE